MSGRPFLRDTIPMDPLTGELTPFGGQGHIGIRPGHFPGRLIGPAGGRWVCAEAVVNVASSVELTLFRKRVRVPASPPPTCPLCMFI